MSWKLKSAWFQMAKFRRNSISSLRRRKIVRFVITQTVKYDGYAFERTLCRYAQAEVNLSTMKKSAWLHTNHHVWYITYIIPAHSNMSSLLAQTMVGYSRQSQLGPENLGFGIWAYLAFFVRKERIRCFRQKSRCVGTEVGGGGGG